MALQPAIPAGLTLIKRTAKVSPVRSIWLALALMCPGFGLEGSLAQQQKSVVFFALDTRTLSTFSQPNPAVVGRLVDALVMAATGKRDVAESWRSLVKPDDIVGIKVAAAAGGTAGTHPSVVDAICNGLIAAGIPPASIVVWDRRREDLLAAGYIPDCPRYALQSIDPSAGYDMQAQITAPVLGILIWGDGKFGDRQGTRLVDRLTAGNQLSSASHWAKVLTKRVTKVINVPSLTDSVFTGINGAIANMTLANVDNWRRFATPPDFGNPYLAEIYADPEVSGKVVFTIMDGLILQFAGGPFPNPNFSRPNYALYASFDPVAIDATAIRLLDELRVANKLPRIELAAGHVKSAAALGLGRYEETEIELRRIGAERWP